MKTRTLAIGAAIALPGGLVIGASVDFARLYFGLSTGDESLDTWKVRGRVSYAALRVFGPTVGLSTARALMAIVNNEYDRRKPLDRQVGDLEASGGPSIGPMQVYRRTARDLGLWAPEDVEPDSEEDRALYEQEAIELTKMFVWGAKVLRDKLKAASDLSDAIRRYNGAGAAAEAYRDRALKAAADFWGGLA